MYHIPCILRQITIFTQIRDLLQISPKTLKILLIKFQLEKFVFYLCTLILKFGFLSLLFASLHFTFCFFERKRKNRITLNLDIRHFQEQFKIFNKVMTTFQKRSN